MIVWIKKPYDQHDARCMVCDSHGHHTTYLDIKSYTIIQAI